MKMALEIKEDALLYWISTERSHSNLPNKLLLLPFSNIVLVDFTDLWEYVVSYYTKTFWDNIELYSGSHVKNSVAE